MGPLGERHPMGNRRIGSRVKLARGVNCEQVSFRSICPGIGSNRGWCINGVTGYPGATATAVVNQILYLTKHDEVQVEWTK